MLSTYTDANGHYLFSGLCAGTYTVTVPTAPAGFTPSPSLVGTDRAIDSNGSPATVTLTAGNTQDRTVDFGFRVPPPPLTLACPAVTTGALGVPYSSALVTTGGTAP